uniref:Amiloride-sensitive sodium channel n=1 Tax=Panagrolaimus superbus TaxID=310955 RepID=A0A914YIK1_9BILA
MFAHGIHVLPGTHVMSHISVTIQQFLEKGLWGKCEEQKEEDVGRFHTLERCQQRCIKKLLLKECQCIPIYFGGNQTNCNQRKCIEMALNKIHPCNCSLPCHRIHFSVQETSMTKLISSFNNYSKITVAFKDKTLITQNQIQRLITVDLLSFVAGSMGLFLGMSCITLLEVFMYLFKAVWGTMNNARYKTYLSKLLGENVSNFLHADPDMSRSHEEIVITQTTNQDNPVSTNLPPVTLQIKQGLTNRKLSIQIGNNGGADAQMLILPRQQRFYAHSHRGIFSSFNSSFEAPTRQNSLKNSFDYDAF